MNQYKINFESVVTGLHPSDIAGCGDEDIMRRVDTTVENAIEAELAALNARLEKLAFPLMSGSVNKIFESPEEYFDTEAPKSANSLRRNENHCFASSNSG